MQSINGPAYVQDERINRLLDSSFNKKTYNGKSIRVIDRDFMNLSEIKKLEENRIPSSFVYFSMLLAINIVRNKNLIEYKSRIRDLITNENSIIESFEEAKVEDWECYKNILLRSFKNNTENDFVFNFLDRISSSVDESRSFYQISRVITYINEIPDYIEKTIQLRTFKYKMNQEQNQLLNRLNFLYEEKNRRSCSHNSKEIGLGS